MSSTASGKAGTHAPKPTAWAATEDYISDTDAAAAARRAAHDLGLVTLSRGAAQTLTFLAAVLDANAVVEIGTGAGVSALALFEGMNQDGVLTTIDPEPEHQNVTRSFVTKVGIRPQRLRTIAGDPLSVLPKLSDGIYDLVVIDGDPIEAPEYLEQALRLLRPGGVVAINHAMLGGTIADPMNSDDEAVIMRDALTAVRELEELTPALLPVGDGLLVAVKRGELAAS